MSVKGMEDFCNKTSKSLLVSKNQNIFWIVLHQKIHFSKSDCNSSSNNYLYPLFSIDQITKKYVGFFIPEEGDALAMAHAFYQFLKKNGLEKILLALSLDGENENTGV